MKPVFERAAAAAIVAIALGLACVWVFRVPLFQQPDENAHADYAFALFAAHGPIRASTGRPATDVDPVVRYLEGASGFRAMRFSGDGRVPAGYGSAAFDRALDAGAPHPSTVVDPRSDMRVPWVAAQYPYLYYALDALAIGVAGLVGGGSVLAEFFGARPSTISRIRRPPQDPRSSSGSALSRKFFCLPTPPGHSKARRSTRPVRRVA